MQLLLSPHHHCYLHCYFWFDRSRAELKIFSEGLLSSAGDGGGAGRCRSLLLPGVVRLLALVGQPVGLDVVERVQVAVLGVVPLPSEAVLAPPSCVGHQVRGLLVRT